MPIIPRVLDYQDELTAIRRDIHAHPELKFKERFAAALLSNRLVKMGAEVERPVGGLERDRLYVLLGAPGSGKTTLANQIADVEHIVV